MADVRLMHLSGSKSNLAQGGAADILKIGGGEFAIGLIVGFDGTPTADKVQIGDVNFNLDASTIATPSINFDSAGDRLRFTRSTNLLELQINGSVKGTMPQGLARAVVNYSGLAGTFTGFNVASVTDNGVGDMDVTWDITFDSVDWVGVMGISDPLVGDVNTLFETSRTVTAVNIITWGIFAGTTFDIEHNCYAAFEQDAKDPP